MYRFIGCPMHIGVSDDGLKSSIETLLSEYPKLKLEKVDVIIKNENNLDNLKNKESIIATCNILAEKTHKIVQNNDIPICIGGDHSLSIGTVSGAVKDRENIGLLWVDSHSDINTDKTTVTGNIHGMPVSALMGLGDSDLCNVYEYKNKIDYKNIVLFGLRDVDPPEKEIIEKYNIKAFYYDDIVKDGLTSSLLKVKEYLKDVDKLHLSFDLDSMDPEIIKGVTVPVKDGFNKDDALQIINFVLENFDILSADIVEFNPKYDTDKETVKFLKVLIDRFLNI